MSLIVFSKVEEFKKWIVTYGKAEGTEILIDTSHRINVSLDGIEGLDLRVLHTAEDSRIILRGGRYKEILINEDRCDLKLTEHVTVDRLTSSGACYLSNSRINYCYSSSRLSVYICDIKTLQATGIILQILEAQIEELKLFNVILMGNIRVFGLEYSKMLSVGSETPIEVSLRFIKESNFELIDCDLSGISFWDCDFSDTSWFVYKANVQLANYSDVKWFSKIKTYSEEGNTDILPRDTCRQLKLAARNIQNAIDADYFKALELHAKFQELKWFSPWFDSKLTLGLNLISNRFERSWLLPLAWIIIFGAGMFGLYFLCSDLTGVENPSLINNLKYYWVFLNPIHDFDLFGEGTGTGLSLFFDTLHRVFNSYFIYQLVAAFRKFRVVG